MQTNYVEDIINRYIHQVIRHLPGNSRKDIEEELKTLIYDILEDRAKDTPPTKEQIDSVLRELGNPNDLAEKYRDQRHYLIGPTLFPTYLFILKIVLAATLLGMTVVTILDLLSATDIIWYEYLGQLIGNLVSGFFMAFTWVTIIFAIFEWRGLDLKEVIPEWDVSSLPEVPTKEISIPLSGPIAEICFSILALILLRFAPQLLGASFYSDGIKSVPIFNLEVLDKVFPLFLACFALGILKNIWEIVDRKYSVKYAVVTAVINTVEILLVIIIFQGFPIWNQSFITELNELFYLGLDQTISHIWDVVSSTFFLFLLLTYVIDIAVTAYKVWRYRTT